MDRGAWWATVYGVAKSQTQRSNKTAMFQTFPETKHCRRKVMRHTYKNWKFFFTLMLQVLLRVCWPKLGLTFLKSFTNCLTFYENFINKTQ